MKWLAVFVALAGPAWAQGEPTPAAVAVVSQALACLNVPPRAGDFSVNVALSLDESGRPTRIEVTEIKPDDARAVAEAVVRALQRCGPYSDQTGDINLLFDDDVAKPSVEIVLPN